MGQKPHSLSKHYQPYLLQMISSVLYILIIANHMIYKSVVGQT